MARASLTRNDAWLRLGASVLYVAVLVGVVILANAGVGGALVVWSATSLGLGWLTRRPWSALLPFLAVAIAVPFGYPDESNGGDPLILWAGALVAAPVQAAFVAAGAWGRCRYERTRVPRA